MIEFVSAAERMKGEKQKRLALAARVLQFNVPVLDDALDGILPVDLVLVGAATGAGKTHLVGLIAQENARRRKRVAMFALEAHENEIEQRLKYREVVHEFFLAGGRNHPELDTLSYTAWWMGRLEQLLGPYEAKAEATMAARYATLRTFYRGAEFTIDDIERLFMSVEGTVDMIVLDHIHYVDDEDENENRAGKKIMKRIRDVALCMQVPVIVVAHLRKKDRAAKLLIPDIDDFHGTSEITKIATKVAVLAPAIGWKPGKAEHAGNVTHLHGTYMAIRKDRFSGPKHHVMRAVFNSRTGQYANDYEIGRVYGSEFKQSFGDDVPGWAKKAIRSPMSTPTTDTPAPVEREPGSDDE